MEQQVLQAPLFSSCFFSLLGRVQLCSHAPQNLSDKLLFRCTLAYVPHPVLLGCFLAVGTRSHWRCVALLP